MKNMGKFDLGQVTDLLKAVAEPRFLIPIFAFSPFAALIWVWLRFS